MPRKSPAIKVTEISGDHFESLEAAQESARVMLDFDLAQIIKSMIAQGTLEIKNGKIIPKEKDERKINDE
jgi:hypothetical protein